MRKWMLPVLTMLLVLSLLPTQAAAHEVPDLEAGGAIAVHLRAEGETPEGGRMTFYHAAQIVEEDGSYSYALTEDFALSGLPLDDVTAPVLADGLAAWAESQHLRGTTLELHRGKAAFSVPRGQLGLYLVVQTQACDGYEPTNSFVISVPQTEDGHYVYTVDAKPKMGGLLEESDDKPGGDTPPVHPDSGQPVLPQTGQLQWPVPVLALTGLVLVLLGWMVCRSSRKKRGAALMLLALCLLGSSLALLVHNHRQDSAAQDASQQLLTRLEETADAAGLQKPSMEMDTVEIDGDRYIGTLLVPDLGLELPVTSEWSYERLLSTPCRYTGNLRSRDLVLMAHNYTAHFGLLSTLDSGAELSFRDVHDQVTTFAVAAIEVVSPDQVETVTEGEYPLTLFTCTYGGRTRVVVRCTEGTK